MVAAGLVAAAGAIYASSLLYNNAVAEPRTLSQRHDDLPGSVSSKTLRVVELGDRAIPTLAQDVQSGTPEERRKAIEILGAIRTPAVLPVLRKALADADLGIQLSALAALGRTGLSEAAPDVWPWTERADDIQRLRAVVVLGLIAPPSDLQRLLTEAKKYPQAEGWVWYWAAGQVQRRAAAKTATGKPFVPPAPIPKTLDDAARQQAEVDAELAALAAGADVAKHALRLAELTACNFDTWDVGHQIARQVIAVAGPNAVRSMGVDAAVAPAPALKTATLPGAVP